MGARLSLKRPLCIVSWHHHFPSCSMPSLPVLPDSVGQTFPGFPIFSPLSPFLPDASPSGYISTRAYPFVLRECVHPRYVTGEPLAIFSPIRTMFGLFPLPSAPSPRMRSLTTPTPGLATVAAIKSKASTIVQCIKSSPCNLVLDAITNGSRALR
jgi:hypothetical protein